MSATTLGLTKVVKAASGQTNAVVQRKHSMSNSNGVDPLRLRQLRAIALNLCTLAKLHRDNSNHMVADALYTRALWVVQQIQTPGNDLLIAQIRKEQQAGFDILEKPPLEKAQRVGG